MEKPVIVISKIHGRKNEPEILSTNSCLVADINDFEETFKDLLLNENSQKQLVQKEQQFVSNYLVNPRTSSRKIIEFIENL